MRVLPRHPLPAGDRAGRRRAVDRPGPRRLADRDREVLRQVGDNPPPRPTSLSGLAGPHAGEPITFPGPRDDDGPLGRLGHYLVLQKLGEGTYGVVFKAFDQVLARNVAIKVLRPELARVPILRERFQREARAVSGAGVENPHVVGVFEVADGKPGFDQPFIVMEFVEGAPLPTTNRPPPRASRELRDATRIGREIALGLTATHGRGVIHRDIKPANALIAKNSGRVRLVDFGIAYVIDQAIPRAGGGSIIGTPEYMSREAFAFPDKVDGRSDIYSLGVVLYQLLTGSLPFVGAFNPGDRATRAARPGRAPARSTGAFPGISTRS